MLLRFLISQGRCPDYLYASIPSFAHWRLSALPFYLQADQVEQVIASLTACPTSSRTLWVLTKLPCILTVLCFPFSRFPQDGRGRMSQT